MTRPRRAGLKQIRWRVTLRGELLGYVFALTWPAACGRAVRRWKLSREDQEELRVEKAFSPLFNSRRFRDAAGWMLNRCQIS
jgi:hypothetical protein